MVVMSQNRKSWACTWKAQHNCWSNYNPTKKASRPKVSHSVSACRSRPCNSSCHQSVISQFPYTQLEPPPGSLPYSCLLNILTLNSHAFLLVEPRREPTNCDIIAKPFPNTAVRFDLTHTSLTISASLYRQISSPVNLKNPSPSRKEHLKGESTPTLMAVIPPILTEAAPSQVSNSSSVSRLLRVFRSVIYSLIFASIKRVGGRELRETEAIDDARFNLIRIQQIGTVNLLPNHQIRAPHRQKRLKLPLPLHNRRHPLPKQHFLPLRHHPSQLSLLTLVPIIVDLPRGGRPLEIVHVLPEQEGGQLPAAVLQRRPQFNQIVRLRQHHGDHNRRKLAIDQHLADVGLAFAKRLLPFGVGEGRPRPLLAYRQPPQVFQQLRKSKFTRTHFDLTGGGYLEGLLGGWVRFGRFGGQLAVALDGATVGFGGGLAGLHVFEAVLDRLQFGLETAIGTFGGGLYEFTGVVAGGVFGYSEVAPATGPEVDGHQFVLLLLPALATHQHDLLHILPLLLPHPPPPILPPIDFPFIHQQFKPLRLHQRLPERQLLPRLILPRLVLPGLLQRQRMFPKVHGSLLPEIRTLVILRNFPADGRQEGVGHAREGGVGGGVGRKGTRPQHPHQLRVRLDEFAGRTDGQREETVDGGVRLALRAVARLRVVQEEGVVALLEVDVGVEVTFPQEGHLLLQGQTQLPKVRLHRLPLPPELPIDLDDRLSHPQVTLPQPSNQLAALLN